MAVSGVSAKWKSSRSAAEMVPYFTSASKLTISFQNFEPYRMIVIFFASFLGLDQREDLEQFVHRAEAARENHQRLRQVREPELAHEEVVELEAEFAGDVRIGKLLERQTDVQPDGLAAGVRRAAVGRFHDARPAAGADHETVRAARVTSSPTP